MSDSDNLASHYTQSVLREIIAEHLFVGRLLQRLWQRGVTDAEVLRSEFDAGGYDLVLSRGEVVRHIQLKTVLANGNRNGFSVSLKLAARPSGCVVVLVLGDQLDLDHALWFGDEPGQPLPDLTGYRITKHTKGNSKGKKTERPGQRVVPRKNFSKINGLDDLILRLLAV